MKITKTKLKQIIKEEVTNLRTDKGNKSHLAESPPGHVLGRDPDFGKDREYRYGEAYNGPELEGEALKRAKELYDKYKPREGSHQDKHPNRYSAWQKAQFNALQWSREAEPELTPESLEKDLEGTENHMDKLLVGVKNSIAAIRSAIEKGDLERGNELLDGLKKGLRGLADASWFMNPHSKSQWRKK